MYYKIFFEKKNPNYVLEEFFNFLIRSQNNNITWSKFELHL